MNSRHQFIIPRPIPTAQNTIPGGTGWYRYNRGFWRRDTFKNANYDGAAMWLDAKILVEFEKERERLYNP